MFLTENQQYGFQCIDGAIDLLSFEINNLVRNPEATGGKAATPGDNVAARFGQFTRQMRALGRAGGSKPGGTHLM